MARSMSHFLKLPMLLRLCRAGVVVILVFLVHQQARWLDAQRGASLSLRQARKFFSKANRVQLRDTERGLHFVTDARGDTIGCLLTTSPFTDNIIGYSGPNDLLIALDSHGAIVGLELLRSGDTREHVEKIRRDSNFLRAFVGWKPGEAPPPKVEGVSGATLTGFAIAESIQQRLAGGAPSLRFPEPVTLDELRTLFTNIVSIVPENTRLRALDASGRLLGFAVRTSPQADNVSGYRGPTECLVALAPDGRTVTAVRVRRSYDTDSYVDQIRRAERFLKLFIGRTIEELAAFEYPKARIEGVSGATQTARAVAEGVQRRSAAELRPQAQIPPWRPKTRDWALSAVIAGALVMSFTSLRGYRPARVAWQLLLVGYVGLVNHDLLSLALFGGWAANGLALKAAPGLVLLTAAALLVPWTTRRQLYCHHICPHGAAQQLLGTIGSWLAAADQSRSEKRSPSPQPKILLSCAEGASAAPGRGGAPRPPQTMPIPTPRLSSPPDKEVSSASVTFPQTSASQNSPSPGAADEVSAKGKNSLGRSEGERSSYTPLARGRRALRTRLTYALEFLPGALLGVALLAVLLGWPVNLASLEPFDAWVWRTAGIATLVIAGVGLAASLFIPQAYCRFGCPTGALLNFVRTTGSADHWGRRDWTALGFVAAGLMAVAGVRMWPGTEPVLEPLRLTGRTMGTTWSAKILDEVADPAVIEAAIADEFEWAESLTSHWRTNTDLSEFNRTATTNAMPVPWPVLTLSRRAAEISRATDGAYDITVGPLVRLWGFGPGPRRSQPPTDSEIDAVLPAIGWQRLEVLDGVLRKQHPALEVDLSSIGVGWAIDQVAQLLERHGYTNFLVEAGGELRARGRWTIAIEHPSRACTLTNESIGTSGTYRRNFRSDGRQYSHLINPRTGRPITHRTVSVSVRHADCADADAWAAALNVLGVEAGLPLAERLNVAAQFVEERTDGKLQVRSSTTWQSKETLIDVNSPRKR
jgi:NosR/NirI family transcriptional regulator, nitrous oxide reductase regulator